MGSLVKTRFLVIDTVHYMPHGVICQSEDKQIEEW